MLSEMEKTFTNKLIIALFRSTLHGIGPDIKVLPI